MNTKRRCGGCRDYFPPEELMAAGGVRVCSSECLSDVLSRRRQVRKQKAVRERKARKPQPSHRIPPDVRAAVRKRDQERCRMCTRKTGLQQHHVRYRSEGGPDDERNLVTLCRTCHELVHSDKRHFQPGLLLWLWLHYEGKRDIPMHRAIHMAHTTEELERAARDFSDEVYERYARRNRIEQ